MIDAAVGFHLFDLLHAGDGLLDGLEIGERAAEPAFRHIELAAFLGGFLDGLLGLLLGADEQHAPPLPTVVVRKSQAASQAGECLAEVDDMNAVAGIEDERLHLGVPTLGLMSEMDACFQ